MVIQLMGEMLLPKEVTLVCVPYCCSFSHYLVEAPQESYNLSIELSVDVPVLSRVSLPTLSISFLLLLLFVAKSRGRAGKGRCHSLFFLFLLLSLFPQITQRDAQAEMTIGMSKGCGEDKRWNTTFHHV